jgi:hypothetical protein
MDEMVTGMHTETCETGTTYWFEIDDDEWIKVTKEEYESANFG